MGLEPSTAVPEVSIDEHRDAQPMKREVGRAENRARVATEANADHAQGDCQPLLRLRSGRSNGAHDRPPLGIIEDVGQGITLI